MKINFTEQDFTVLPNTKEFIGQNYRLLNGTKSHQCWSQVPGKGYRGLCKRKLNTPYTRYDIQIDCIEKRSSTSKNTGRKGISCDP